MQQARGNAANESGSKFSETYGRADSHIKWYMVGAAGSSAIGIGVLAYLSTREQTGARSDASTVEEMMLWPDYVRQRVRNTYLYFAGSCISAGATAVALFQNPRTQQLVMRQGMVSALLGMAAVLGTGILCQALPYQGAGFDLKHVAWLTHSATIGFVLAPLCMLGGPLLSRAALYTAGVVGGLSAVAASAKSDRFLQMRGALSMGLGVMFIGSLASIFAPAASKLSFGLQGLLMWGGLVLFSGMMLYETQAVVQRSKHASTLSQRQFDPINNQIGIFMSTVNIFIRIAMILAGGGGNRRK